MEKEKGEVLMACARGGDKSDKSGNYSMMKEARSKERIMTAMRPKEERNAEPI